MLQNPLLAEYLPQREGRGYALTCFAGLWGDPSGVLQKLAWGARNSLRVPGRMKLNPWGRSSTFSEDWGGVGVFQQ